MCSLAVFSVLMLHHYSSYAQTTRIILRKIDHLERRHELESSRTSESFREIWDYISQQDEKCCKATETNIATGLAQEKTDPLLKKEMETLDKEINVIRNAFVDEKKAVRNWMNSFEDLVSEYNLTFSARIEKLERKSDANKKDFCTCLSKWLKIFENGPNGEVLFGDRSDLIQAALTGSSVKILADKRYFTNVQNLKPMKGHLMAQALFHISMSIRKFQDNAYWWFVLVSTTGHWYMSRYNVGEHVFRGDNEIKYGIEWFIRRPCGMDSALRTLHDGTVAYGSINNVITAVRNGFPVRITSLKSGYTFPADNLEVSGDHVAAQSLWHLSQQSSSDYSRVIFQKRAYWYFTNWATTGIKRMSRWTVGKHESRGSTSDRASVDWFIDPCWRLAYRHGPQGGVIEGSKAQLIDAIRKGHRARIVYKDFSFEPNALLISDGEVHALSMDSVSKLTFDQFDENVSWIWRSTSTDGKLQILKSPVGDSKNTLTNERVQMAWFVDKREWKETVSITGKGEAFGGSKLDLFKYTSQGADVRIGVKQSDDKEYVYLQPDNISLFHKEISLLAMHIRQASFYPEILPSWIFTLTNTGGLRDTSIWALGEHKQVSHKEERVQTVWFISE